MDSTLSGEEFQRLQTHLLELKTDNYSLEEQKRKNVSEIQTLRQRTEALEKQLSRQQTVNKINPLSLARNIANKVDNKLRDREVDQLVAENENLMRKIESQEQEFRVTNETLKTEIQALCVANGRLEDELKTYRDIELHPECDIGVNYDQNRDNNNFDVHSTASSVGVGAGDQSQHLSYAVLAEKEKLELKVYDLQELVQNVQKENQLVAKEVDGLQSKCTQLQQELNSANNLIERQNTLIEEMSAHKTELEVEFRSDCERLKAEHKTKVDVFESNLKARDEKNETLEKKIEELMAELCDFEGIRKENDKLFNELQSYKEELDFCRVQSEDTVQRLERECNQRCDELRDGQRAEEEALRRECDDHRHRVEELDAETKRLNQRIVDDIEERKIHEKKGVLMVKDLKRQANSERKRADKLQAQLQQLMDESTTSISNDIQRKQSFLTNNGNDSSSVGSWSFMSAKEHTHNRTSSIHSACSEGRESSTTSPISPTGVAADTTTPGVGERNAVLLEKENNELVSRITSLQEEKWVLEERINQLELSVSALNEDMARKRDIIEYYAMEGRPDRHPGPQGVHSSTDRMTVKRLVDFIKDKGDENMREINRKVHRMLEETLTKNMHLQRNLDSLSQEVVRLNKLIESPVPGVDVSADCCIEDTN